MIFRILTPVANLLPHPLLSKYTVVEQAMRRQSRYYRESQYNDFVYAASNIVTYILE